MRPCNLPRSSICKSLATIVLDLFSPNALSLLFSKLLDFNSSLLHSVDANSLLVAVLVKDCTMSVRKTWMMTIRPQQVLLVCRQVFRTAETLCISHRSVGLVHRIRKTITHSLINPHIQVNFNEKGKEGIPVREWRYPEFCERFEEGK